MGQLIDIDVRITNLLQGKPKTLQRFMVFISLFGHPLVIIAMGLALAFLAFRAGQPSIMIGFLLVLAALSISSALKLSLKRARPATLYVSNMRLRSFSFPSGHAFGSVVLYGYITAIALKYELDVWAVLYILLLLAMIICIGFSRVYLGAHYVSDVLGGWLLSLIALAVIIGLTL